MSIESVKSAKTGKHLGIVRVASEIVLSMLMTGRKHVVEVPGVPDLGVKGRTDTVTILKGVPLDAEVCGCSYSVKRDEFVIRYKSDFWPSIEKDGVPVACDTIVTTSIKSESI